MHRFRYDVRSHANTILDEKCFQSRYKLMIKAYKTFYVKQVEAKNNKQTWARCVFISQRECRYSVCLFSARVAFLRPESKRCVTTKVNSSCLLYHTKADILPVKSLPYSHTFKNLPSPHTFHQLVLLD